jgi:hypothetical protein
MRMNANSNKLLCPEWELPGRVGLTDFLERETERKIGTASLPLIVNILNFSVVWGVVHYRTPHQHLLLWPTSATSEK